MMTNHVKIIIASVLVGCWIGCMVWLAKWAGISEYDAGNRIAAWPYLAGMGIFAIVIITALIFLRWRLMFCAILSLALVSVLVALWIGSMSACRAVKITTLDWKVMNGEKYLQNQGLSVSSSRGGVCVVYEMGLRSGDAIDEYLRRPDWAEYSPFITSLQWGRLPADRYAFAPELSMVKSVPKPIPKWGGFDSCWIVTPDSVPTVVGYWDQRDICAITVPMWFLILPCMIFPVFWLRRLLRQRYRCRHNLCLKCGYDRHMHQPTDKCPECGAIPTPLKESAVPPKEPIIPPPTIPSGG